MKALILTLALATTGCSTLVPVTQKFPEPPGQLVREACPQLQPLNEGAKLSDVSKTVVVNYSTYYECAIKLNTWIRWYDEQRVIYERLK